MGRLIGTYDWSATSLGAIESWPQSLLTILALMLHSRYPKFLFWGPQLYCFYNDAYKPSLGENGKHPSMLGMPGHEAWGEIWSVIAPLIQQVLEGGEATWNEDQLIPIFRNGRMEDVYWTFSYSPAFDESGIGGVLVTCTETTEKVRTLRNLAESNQQLSFAIEAAEMATWDYNPMTDVLCSNERLRGWFGLPDHTPVQLSHAFESIVPEDRERVMACIQQAFDFEGGGTYNIEYSIEHQQTKQRRIVHAKGKAWFNDQRQPIRFNGTLQDVTEQATARRIIEEREEQLRIALQGGELGTYDFDVATGRLEWSEKTKELFGFNADAVVDYNTYIQALHPDDRAVLARIEEQQARLEKGGLYEIEYRVIAHKNSQMRWLRSKGKITYNQLGEAVRYTGIVQDVTQQRQAEEALRKSEGQLRAVIDSAPFPIGVYIGEEMRIQLVNQAIIDALGRGSHLEGRRYADVLPELVGTGIYDQLHQVYTTGIPFKARNQRVDLLMNGHLQPFYFNYDFTPLFDASGKVYGVMNTAADVTDLNLAKQKIEASEREFRQLADSLPVMIWTTDANGNQLFASRRWEEFTGLRPLDATTFAQMAHPDELAGLMQEWGACMAEAKPFKSNVRLKDKTGNYQWFYVNGEPIFNEAGEVEKWTGAYTNINEQKKAERELVNAFIQLEASDKRFRNTVQEAPLGIAILNGKDFVVDMANTRYLQLVDKASEGFIGTPLFDSMPEVRPVIEQILNNILLTGEPFYAPEFPIMLNRYGRAADMSYFNVTYHPLKDESGATWGVMVVATEVTELVQAKQQLAASEQQLRNLVMQSPIAMAIFRGPKLIIEIANNVMVEKMWGKKREAVIGKALEEAFPELAQQQYPAVLRAVIESGKPFSQLEAMAYVEAADGVRRFWIDWDCLPMMGQDGTIDAVMVTVNDVTEKVNSRRIVEESEQRSRLAIDAANMGTFDWDLLTGKFNHSKRLAAIFGFANSTAITHQQLIDTIHPHDRTRRDEALKAVTINGSLHYEARLIWPDQSVHWVKVYGKLLYDEQRQPIKMYGTAVDITEEKANTIALEENTARLNIALDSAEMGTWELDLTGCNHVYSERFLQILGFEEGYQPGREDLVAKVHPDDLEMRNAAVKDALRQGLLDIDLRIVPTANTIRWVKTKGKVFYDDKGVPVKMLGTTIDITEARNSLSILQESEERFRNVANNAPVLIWMAGTDLRRYFFNTAWLDFKGRTMEQEWGHGWVAGVHPEDMAFCFGTYAAAFQNRESFIVEYRMLRNDGEYRWVSDKGEPRFTNTGEFEGYIGACLDVHDDKLSSEKILKSELLFKTIANASPVGLWMTDAEGRCTFVNETWCAWTGMPIEQQLGINWLKVIVPEDATENMRRFMDAQQSKERFTSEFRIQRADGSLQWCWNEASAYYDIHGNFAGYAGSVTDINERKMIQQQLEVKVAERTAELREVNEALEKSNTELEQFAYVASHDLQEPLRKIRFFTERIENLLPDGNDAAREIYQKIQKAADRMTTLIKDLLDFSRLAKSNELFVPTDLNPLMDQIRHDLELLIQQKEATLLIDPLPTIQAVPLQMQQLFYNLLSNSLKFTRDGVTPVIRIQCSVPAAAAIIAHGLDVSLDYCLITIADNGIGFEQEYAEQIFVIFQRLNDLYTYGGTGIGLALCKKIVLNHKGKIYAEGIEGQGATFYLLLPISQRL